MKAWKTLLMGTAFALLGGWAMAGELAKNELTFDIPAQQLSDALNAFGRQAGLSIAFYDEAVAGRTGQAVSGRFTPQAALVRLLADTTLGYEFVNAHTVAIRS